MPQGVNADTIRAQLIPIQALDEDFMRPFILAHGAVPPEQHPVFAPLLNADARLQCFRFFKEEDGHGHTVGYAIIKLRHHILADAYFAPVVLQAADYPGCVMALKAALRRMGRLILRLLPPVATPHMQGSPAAFNWSTMVVNIDHAREALTRSFSVNHRHSIQKAITAGVLVKPLQAKDAAVWLKGYLGMFSRRGIFKNEADARAMLTAMIGLAGQADGDVFIKIAWLSDGITLAGGGIFLCNGDTCTYYQGFAERLQPPLPVMHLILLEAMLEAASRGCTRFDLYGYPPGTEDKQINAIKDFKRWFRGDVLEYPRTVLLPLYSIASPLMKWLHSSGRL